MDKLEEKIDEISKKVDEIGKQDEEDKKPKEEEKQEDKKPEEDEKKAEDKEDEKEKKPEEENKQDEKPSDLESRVAGLESQLSEIKSMLTTATKAKAEGEKVTLPKVPQEETADEKPETDKVKLTEKMDLLSKKVDTITKSLVVNKSKTPRPVMKDDDDDKEDVEKSDTYALDVAMGKTKFDFQAYHDGLMDKHDEMLNKALGR